MSREYRRYQTDLESVEPITEIVSGEVVKVAPTNLLPVAEFPRTDTNGTCSSWNYGGVRSL